MDKIKRAISIDLVIFLCRLIETWKIQRRKEDYRGETERDRQETNSVRE